MATVCAPKFPVPFELVMVTVGLNGTLGVKPPVVLESTVPLADPLVDMVADPASL
jgi:hypothetical protein